MRKEALERAFFRCSLYSALSEKKSQFNWSWFQIRDLLKESSSVIWFLDDEESDGVHVKDQMGPLSVQVKAFVGERNVS